MSKPRFAVVVLLGASILSAVNANVQGTTLILPRPVIEKSTGERVILAGKKNSRLTVELPNVAEGPLAEGLTLLRQRVSYLGCELATGGAGSPAVQLTRCDDQALARWLNRHGLDQKLEPGRARQAYHLFVDSSSTGRPLVSVQATHDWGLYYAMASLCQILEVDAAGNLVIPSVEILDFPEIAHRLAKVGAESTPSDVAGYTALLPLFKISEVGLQYHGQNSRHPEPDFTTNIKTLCPLIRKQGTLESIVYFCPFRKSKQKDLAKGDEAYDFSSDADKSAYAEYLLWIMAQGAHGIEVDYNDWPGSADVPISDVLNLAFQTVKKRYPEAYVLYCPPSTGKQTYRGPATPEMTQTLSRVPASIWPLWTGPATLTRQPMPAAPVEQWTKDAGRRPFLWLNRVGLNVKEPFSRPVPGLEGKRVFAGDRLPRDLNRLFEGVHFNTSLVPGIGNATLLPEAGQTAAVSAEELVYLATAADFVWNPRAWDPAESYRRAVHFVEVMIPLQKTETRIAD